MNEEIPKSIKPEELFLNNVESAFVKSESEIEDEKNINKSIQLEESEGILKSLLLSHLLSPIGEDNQGHIEENRTTYSYNDFEHIEGGKFKCIHCNFTAYFCYMIKEHIRKKHLKVWNYECDLCEFKAYYEQSVFKHLKSNHLNLNDSKCYKCNEEVESKADYERHIKNYHFSKKKCTKCDFSTSNNRTLKSHINTVHKKTYPKYKCQYCNYKSNRQKSYRTHVIKVHLTIKKCDLCHYTANTSRIIEEHVSNVHLKRINGFKCIYCNYHTTKRNDLKIHFEINHFNYKEPSEQIETKELYVDREMSDEVDIHIGIKTEEVMLDDFELPLEGTSDINYQMLSEENFEERVKEEEDE